GVGRGGEGEEGDGGELGEGEEAEDLPGLGAVRRGDGHLTGREHAQIAVTALAAVQEERRGPSARQRRRDLASHDAGLAHAGDDDLAAARQQDVEGAIERRPETLAHRGDAGPLDVEHATGPTLALGDQGATSVRTTRAMAASSRSNAGRSSRRTLCAPSDRARPGVSAPATQAP